MTQTSPMAYALDQETPPAETRPLDQEAQAQLFAGAHTPERYDARAVSDQQLSAIWDLAKWPPTSANFQPLRVLYVQSEEGRARLGERMNDNNRAKTIAAPAVAVLAMDREFHEHIPFVAPHRAAYRDVLHANVAGRLDAARNNSWLQAGYFLLAVRAEGLAAGPMGGFDAAGVDADFFPDGRLGSILVVTIGHPAEDGYRPRLPRLDPDEVVRWA